LRAQDTKNIIIINCRSSRVKYLPMYEIFLADRIEKTMRIKPKIITLFDEENPHFLLEDIKNKDDLIIFWEYFTTKSSGYLGRYFGIARFLKSQVKNPLFFGGFWPTTHGRYFKEFDIFDHLFEGYSIDKVVKELGVYNNASARYLDVRGAVDWNRYELNLDYLHNKDVYFHDKTLWGYLSSFSCPRDCKFCFANSARNDGSHFSARSTENVKKDIDSLIKKYGDIKEIVIKDLNFFYDKKRAFGILNYINSKKIKTSVNLDVTIYDIDEEFLERLGVSGVLSELYLGIESFSEDARKRVGKPFTTERLEKVFEMADRYEIGLTGNIILGLPWQDEDEIKDAVNKALFYMKKYKNVHIAMNVWKPEYGSDLQREYCRDLHEKISFYDLIEVYKNNVSGLQEKLYGEKFNFIDLEKVHNCIKMVMNAKRMKKTSGSRLGRYIIDFIKATYESQFKEPYFRNRVVSHTLKRKRVDFMLNSMALLLARRIDSVFFKNALRKMFKFSKQGKGQGEKL